MYSLPAGSLLAFVGGTLIEEALAVSSLLFFVSSLLVEMALAGHCLEAMVLVLPQFVHSLFPVLVGGLLAGVASSKNSPSQWRRQE